MTSTRSLPAALGKTGALNRFVVMVAFLKKSDQKY